MDTGLSRARVSGWVDALPFPLAATLHLYRVRRDDAERFDSLLHFYEGASELLAAILAAPALRDDAYLSTFQAAAAETLANLVRASFGNWVFLGESLAGGLRELGDDRVASLLEIRDPGRIAAVQDPALWRHLRDTNGLRNKYGGHGAMAAPGQVRRQLDEVEAKLAPVADRLVAIFDGWMLVRPGLLALRGGRYHNRVEILTGSNQQFDQDDLVLDEGLEQGGLYMVEQGGSRAVLVPPVVRVVTEEDRALHAAYFFSRVNGTRAEWISRHLGGVPTLKDDAAGILEFISRLQRSTTLGAAAASPSTNAQVSAGAAERAADSVASEPQQAPEAPIGERASAPLKRSAASPDSRPVPRQSPKAESGARRAYRRRPGNLTDLLARADDCGVGDAMRAMMDVLESAGLPGRVSHYFMTYYSPSDRRHSLFVVGPDGDRGGRLTVYVAVPASLELDFPWLDAATHARLLGTENRRTLTAVEGLQLAEALRRALIHPQPRSHPAARSTSVTEAVDTREGSHSDERAESRRRESVEAGRRMKPVSSERDARLQAFWMLVVPRASALDPLFESIRPRPYPFVTKSTGGITYRMNIKKDNASVWVVFGGRDARSRFDRLHASARFVEEAFGGSLNWEQGTVDPFIWAKASASGLDDEARWEQTALELADAMTRLASAVNSLS